MRTRIWILIRKHKKFSKHESNKINNQFLRFNDAIVDGIGERGMRDSSIIRYNEVHDMYDKIIKDLGDISAYVSKNYIYDKIRERTGLSTRHISRILNHTKKKDLRFI